MRFLLVFFLLLLPLSTLAADTRGISIVAKDPKTGQAGEVQLYRKTYAVIVGIDRYQNLPPDKQLKNAVKDARGVEAVLRKNYHFDEIIILTDAEATKDRVLEVLTEELPARMTKDDALFLFWAGHGNQEKSEFGELGYLIPYDGSLDKIRKNLTMTELRDTIGKKLPAKHVFYVMDACYSGLLASTRSLDTRPKRDLEYLKEITKESVRQVLTAGGKGEEALDGGPKGHSVFTGRLIEVLEAAGDFVTANEIQAILREKVFQDARARNHTQTPGFGTLYGNGDFVFVPNIEQKVQDNKAELARMEAELKRYELQEAEASKYQDEQQQREAEQRRKAAEARLKAEQIRQEQLADETRRQQKMAEERARFDAEQKLKEQELAQTRNVEEQRMAALKAELAKKRQSVPTASTGSLDAAVAEIRRLNKEIEEIEATFSSEIDSGKGRITTRYDGEIAAVLLAAKQLQTQSGRDEFESDAEYNARSTKQQASYRNRIAELEQKKQEEIRDLKESLAREQQSQTTDLRQTLKQLGDKEYSIGTESLVLELGQYNPEQQNFPVTIRNRTQSVKVAMNGIIQLPRDSARKFKQEYSSGLVRPQMTVKAGSGEVITAALANDLDNSLYEFGGGEFVTVTERKRRELEAAAAASAERDRMVYTDPQTGLMWSRNGNTAGKTMNWNDALSWVDNLTYFGYSDWRLPTKEEFKSFTKRGGDHHLEWFRANDFNIPEGWYWTSTTYTFNKYFAWVAMMEKDRDGMTDTNKAVDFCRVWPVRDGD